MIDDYAFQERAAIMEYDGGLPRVWAEWLAQLQTMAMPQGYSPERWDQIINDALGLMAHLPKLTRNDWGPNEVKKLVMMLQGRPVVDVGYADVIVRFPAGNTDKIYFRPIAGAGVAGWDEGRRVA